MEETLRLAHIAQDGREQSLPAHLEGTARLCAQYAKAFDAEQQGALAGLAHDVGKQSAAFQRRLRGGARVDHTTAGAFECYKRGQPYAAFAIAGHHGGLPDGGGQGDHEQQGTFLGRMNRAAAGKLEPYDGWDKAISLPPASLPAIDKDPFEMAFFTRMLFSCLVDADYLDTEAFMEKTPPRGGGDDMDVLGERLLQHVSGWFPPKTALNEQRCAILRRCIEQASAQKPGLLTVPTGGGKTVASLAFALEHARAHGLRRIVYVIPYTSIIEQTAEIFRTILGEQNVLEHHAGVLFDGGDEATPASARMAAATENWDVPVVVTTAVQFFESLFACRPSQCRKLHNLAGSVLIFDEAQMLPAKHLRPCVSAMAQLVKRYGASAVLCTATQPALEEMFADCLPDTPAVELCPPEVYDGELFKRVRFCRAGRLSWEQLAQRMNGRHQALCVVNSRQSAQALFAQLEQESAFHLSTLMYPAHRKAQLAEIRRRLQAGLPCRVVSTSLIEAGVDVDFPAVYREEAGLDSVLQAAGRCNREGRLPARESVVTIFQSEGRTPPLFAMPIGAGRSVMARHADLFDQRTISSYFRELRDLMGNQALDESDILRMIRQELLPFRKVAEAFRLIDNNTKTIYIPFERGAPLVQRLREGERGRDLMRRLGQYGVSVYEQHFETLRQSGDLELLEGEIAVLCNPALYNGRTGLSLEADFGKGMFV